MQTLGDVKQLIGKLNIAVNLFGCSPDWLGDFQGRCSAIGRAICEEQGLTRKQALGLPDDTPLGVKSEELAQALQLFYEKQLDK